MKFLSINRITITVLFLAVTALFSCQKESSSSNSNDVTEEQAVTFSDESAQAEASFDDVEDISMQAAEEEGEVSAPNGRLERLFPFSRLRDRLGPCAVITVTPDDSTYPKTVTIDFPGDGCWCADGKHRKGAIILHFTGPIRRSGSVLTITFRDFYLNRAHIEGTKIVSNLSTNGALKYTVQVVGGKVTFPNGRGYKYNGLKYVAQIDGATTNNNLDDVYKIEGRSKTEFNNGLTITLDTESPLIKKVACRWISDGTLKIKINSRVLFLDYGAPSNGDCDNKALLTWNNGNNHRLITLP
jgi:hypothetical protein